MIFRVVCAAAGGALAIYGFLQMGKTKQERDDPLLCEPDTEARSQGALCLVLALFALLVAVA